MLFAPAGTLNWPRAWVYLTLLLVGTTISSVGLLNADPELLAERLRPPAAAGQSAGDKLWLPAMLGLFIAMLAMAPVDIFRLRLMPAPSLLLSALGLGAVIVGWWIAASSMRANAFATSVVRHQPERGQTVVDRGPYALVRHPMYAGGALFILGTPLFLGSSAATALGIACVACLLARTMSEDRFLKRVLPGYAKYMRRVRYRLVPFVW